MKYIDQQVVLAERLDAYAATLRTSAVSGALKRSVEKWPVYATVTGAALAMASNASASIIYSGLLNNKTVTLASTAATTFQHTNNVSVQLRNGHGIPIGDSFDLALAQFGSASGRRAIAGVFASNLRFLGNSELLARLSSGAEISGSQSFASGPHFVRYQRISSGVPHTLGWSQTKGFAGFSFFNNGKQRTDYGWVRLQYGFGSNGLINSLTAIDYAYDDTGAAIQAGAGLANTPEPSTMALMLLAAGASGVEALRKRRALP